MIIVFKRGIDEGFRTIIYDKICKCLTLIDSKKIVYTWASHQISTLLLDLD